MVEVEIKEIDSQGRFTIPSKWREKAIKNSKEVIVLMYPNYLKILPKKQVSLTKYFDKIKIENIEDLTDYHWVRKAIRKI